MTLQISFACVDTRRVLSAHTRVCSDFIRKEQFLVDVFCRKAPFPIPFECVSAFPTFAADEPFGRLIQFIRLRYERVPRHAFTCVT